MSSPIMLAKPEEIDTPEKRGKYTATIIGCEQTGIFQAILFADAGFKTICVDTDPTKINNITKCKLTGFKGDAESRIRGYVKTGLLNATTDMKEAVSQSDIIAITIPTKIDSKKKPDYSEIRNTCKIIGSNLRGGSLIFNMSIAGIGVTEGIVKETLENASGYKAGTHFAVVYAPTSPSSRCSTFEAVKECQRIAATSDKRGLQAGAATLESLTKKTVCTTENTRTAEAAILFEIAREDSETAVATELACLCEKLGVDCLEAQKLMNHNCNYQMLPLGEVNRHIDEEAYILLEDAENLNVKLRLPAAAREINEETAKHTANLAKDALRNCGKTLKRARVVLLGISQTLNARGPASRVVREIAETFEARGAKLSVYDPYFSERELAEFQHNPRKTLSENLEGADCIVLLVAHEQFKNLSLNRLKHMMKMPAAIVDLTGTFEPDKVEKEGFTYRGLGRGVWTK
jgi:nucleotide sugar dehydrogenase